MRHLFVVMCIVAITAGCSRDPDYYGQVDLVGVSGVIKLDGQPVAGAVVIFQDLKSELQSYALTDSAGKYRLRFDSVKHGVIPGKKMVIVSTTKKIPGLNTDEESGEGESEDEDGEGKSKAGGKKSSDRIPSAYRGKKSVLRATVGQSNVTMNFNLKSDGSTKGPE